MTDEDAVRIGIVGRDDDTDRDIENSLFLLDFVVDLFFVNLQVAVTDAADGSDSPVLRWAEKRDLIVRPFTEPMPPETLGFWARRRAMRARCRRFVERCDCVYLIERKGLRTRMIQKCCRRRGISCFVD